MPSFRLLAPALLALALCGTPPAASAQSFSDSQRGEIETIVRNYLIAHPEVLEEAMAELSKRQAAADAEKHEASVAANAETIFNSPRGVMLGNKDGDVTFVEFFDYNCGYCKRAMADMLDLMKTDPKLKVVLKEFPVLSEGSVEAAKVAVAVRMQDPSGKKYLDFHQKLLGGRGPADKARALAAAKEAGLDIARIEKDHGEPGSARHDRGKLQARRGDGHERHAELRDRQAGGGRRGRPRRPQGKDRPRPLRQGDLLSADSAIGRIGSERPAAPAGLFICSFAQFLRRTAPFIAHSQNKADGTADIGEHRASPVVVGAGNANT